MNDSLRLAAVQIDYLPNAITAVGKYWVPEEPLLGPGPLANSEVAKLEHSLSWLCGVDEGLTSLREVITERYAESIRARLLRVLTFCVEASVDIVVLPEYCVPPRLIDTLIGFSSEMVIVAGLGIVRAQDLDSLGRFEFEELPKPGSNVAAVLGPGVRKFVSKQHGADHEYFEPGLGPEAIEVEIRGAKRVLGVAICMDYLHLGHAFGDRGTELDVAAIPSLTSNTDPFTPDQPRDFPRVFANHARFGGSEVMLPRPQAAAFVHSGGSAAAFKEEELVVVCDFGGFQTAPKTMRPPKNELVFRASVMANPTAYEDTVITNLSKIAEQGEVEPDLMRQLGQWQDHLAADPSSAGLAASLAEYRRLAGSGVLSLQDRKLLSTHIRVPGAPSSKVLRAEQAALVVDALGSEPGRRSANVEYEEVSESSDARGPVGQSPEDPEADTRRHTYFALTLGSYDEESARGTLPYQLDLLRAFALSFSPDVRLSYRLTTRAVAETNDLRAHFDVILGGGQEPEAVEALVDQFVRSYRAILLTGWSCYGSAATADLGGVHRYRVAPRDRSAPVPAIRADWGGVVDVLRAQSDPLTLQLSCAPLIGETQAGELLETEDSLVSGPAIDVVDFLRGQDQEHAKDSPSLNLGLQVASESPVKMSLLNLLGAMMLGHDQFEVREYIDEDQDCSGFAVRPDQALRIFHPPHGHIEGRGLGGSRPLRLQAREIPIVQTGCVMGMATAARAYVDTEFDVAIDDLSRLQHVYVIGKTGTGKTNLLKNMVRQDIESGAGVAVIDPHGDLAEYALGHCGSRADDCVYLDFADPQALPNLNPFGLDVDDEKSRLLSVEELIDQLVRRSHNAFYGPRFEDIVRLALDTLALDSSDEAISLLDVPKVFRDTSFRKSLIGGADVQLRGRWSNFTAMGITEQAELTNWVLAKFSELEQSEVLRSVLAGGAASLSLRRIIGGRGILIARLPEVEIGSRASSFLGSLLVTRIARHIVEGGRRPLEEGEQGPTRRPFYLYADEFQKFVGAGFESLIPEARKFDLGLVLAHQNTDQLNAFSRFEGARDSSVLTQILGNVGSIVAFRGGSRDARLLSQEIRVSEASMLQVDRFHAIVRLLRSGVEQDPMTIKVKDSADEPGYPETRRRIRRQMQDLGVVRPISIEKAELREEEETAGGKEAEILDTERDERNAKGASPKFDASLTDRSTLPPETVDLSQNADTGAHPAGDEISSAEPGGVRTARRRFRRRDRDIDG
jgi:hypothetical protein